MQNTQLNTNANIEAPWLSFQRLPQLLRGLGATTLIAAVSIFLLQGWEENSDLSRYFLLLGHTALLALAGFSSHLWMGESKGARLLLLLSIASIPANFAIVGGFLYSQFPFDATAAIYPGFVSWKTDSSTTAMVASLSVFAVAIPLCWLSFKVLARRSSKTLTGLFCLSNALLLLPVRDHLAIAIIVPGLMLLISAMISSARKQDPTLSTPEGIAARGILLIPLAIMMGRTVWLYEPSDLFFTTLAFMSFILLRQWATQIPSASVVWHRLLGVGSAVIALFASSGAVIVTANWVDGGVWLLVLFSTLWAAMLLDISLRIPVNADWYLRAAALVMGSGMLLALVVGHHALLPIAAIATGIGFIIAGFSAEQRLIFIIGVITTLAGIGLQTAQIMANFDLTSWGGMATLGITAILAGSIIERRGTAIKQQLGNWGQRFKQWRY